MTEAVQYWSNNAEKLRVSRRCAQASDASGENKTDERSVSADAREATAFRGFYVTPQTSQGYLAMEHWGKWNGAAMYIIFSSVDVDVLNGYAGHPAELSFKKNPPYFFVPTYHVHRMCKINK